MSWFSDGLARGVDTLVDAAGDAVTLSRASTTNSTTAVLVDHDDGADGDNATSNYWDREWMVKQADYEIDDVVLTPQIADRITDSNGDIWELMTSSQLPVKIPHSGGYAWIVKTKRIVVG